ncbi:MAG TPA: hypothetical protein DIW47_14385 [Bacteroidetes bacterium]|nr:hypothetical protein [Bacteroidota bacterium]
MKKIIPLFLFGLLLIAACEKEESPVQRGEKLPFEDGKILLELVSASVPERTLDIHFFDESTGIVVTNEGEIFRTNDGGLSWDLKYTNSNQEQKLVNILFTDNLTGYVIGGASSCNGTGCIPPGGILLKTTDGGNSWTKLFHVPKVEFVSVAQNATGDLFMIANKQGSYLYMSSNLGNDWTLVDSFPFRLQKISFTTNTGFISGSEGKMLRSTDNGSTWNTGTLVNANYVTDIEFNNGMNYCLSNNQTIYQSNDNGMSWVAHYTSSNRMFTITPLSTDAFLAFGEGHYSGGCFGRSLGAIGHSSDGGKRWAGIELADTYPIQFVSFISPTKGFAVAGTKLIRVTVK